MDNKSLLQKADLALADLANGGLLNSEQSDSFIRKLVDAPVLTNRTTCRFVPMRTPQKKIEKIGFGKRIMRAANAGTHLVDAPADVTTFDPSTSGEYRARAKPHMSKIELNVKEIMAEVEIPYDVMEDNIERAEAANNEASNTGPGGLRQTIIELIGEQSAYDIEELCVLGDTTLGNADPYLDLFDGWLKRGEDDGNVVDVNGATVSKNVFKAGLFAMPDKYKRRVGDLTHVVSVNNEIEYRDTLANRVGGLGDANVTGETVARYGGSAVIGASVIPGTKGLLTNTKNLIMGVHRDISMEFDKDPGAREYIIYVTMRLDVQIEEAEAIVVYDNISPASE